MWIKRSTTPRGVRVLNAFRSGGQPFVASMDPSTLPTRSAISTNQRREMLLFLARFCLTRWYRKHWLGTHWLSAVLSFFGSIIPQQNGCMGAYRVIDLEQFPVRISTDKAPTPLTKFGICSFFFFFFCHSPFFLCLYHLVSFMAFQSVLVGTTPAFTVIINNTKR